MNLTNQETSRKHREIAEARPKDLQIKEASLLDNRRSTSKGWAINPTCGINKIKENAKLYGFVPIDIHFANCIVKIENTDDPILYITAMLCSQAQRTSHVCINIEDLAEKELLTSEEEINSETVQTEEKLIMPTLNDWNNALVKFKKCVGHDLTTPIVCDGNLIYLQRYFNYETILANMILKFRGEHETDITRDDIKNISSYFFQNKFEDDKQQQAVELTLKNKFTVITGGPGTGKTTVVAAILALKIANSPYLKIALCAPTGKAQARMKESIKEQCEGNIQASIEDKEKINNIPCSTIHSLLGTIYNTPKFKHDEKNPLDLDLIIVDEASMVPLPLMTRLFKAIPKNASVVLLGDKDQLASVEAGAVLADICDSRKLENCIATLTKSHRFDDARGIGNVKNT